MMGNPVRSGDTIIKTTDSRRWQDEFQARRGLPRWMKLYIKISQYEYTS